jgi:hypothetical protein
MGLAGSNQINSNGDTTHKMNYTDKQTATVKRGHLNDFSTSDSSQGSS